MTKLEEEFNAIDASEEVELFLGRSRLDGNPTRKDVLGRLDKALLEYGE